jgi:hypothetical protein
MNHQKKVVTKQVLDNSREYSKIRTKIKELKLELNRFHQNKMGELYKICEEIVRLKQALPENRGVGKRYTFCSLEWENDIGLSSMDIRYIQSYKFISDYGKKCVSNNLITDTAICHFLAISSLLREEKWQNKLIDLVIAKKIKTSQVSELTKEELKLFLEGKLKRKISDDYFFTATKTLRSITIRIKERKHLFHKSNFSNNLFRSIENLYFEMLKMVEEQGQ